jgi:hypothetical protein
VIITRQGQMPAVGMQSNGGDDRGAFLATSVLYADYAFWKIQSIGSAQCMRRRQECPRNDEPPMPAV